MHTALVQAGDLEALDELFPGVTTIIETWFSSYKGPGEIEALGFAGAEEAERVLDAAIEAFVAGRKTKQAA